VQAGASDRHAIYLVVGWLHWLTPPLPLLLLLLLLLRWTVLVATSLKTTRR